MLFALSIELIVEPYVCANSDTVSPLLTVTLVSAFAEVVVNTSAAANAVAVPRVEAKTFLKFINICLSLYFQDVTHTTHKQLRANIGGFTMW